MSARTAAVARAAMPSRARMRGLSLIELMIAMTISLFVLAALGWVYQGTVQTYRTHDSLSRMQESARYAFELIGKDLRMTGTTACPYQTSTNVLTNNTDWYKDLFRRPLASVEKDGAVAAVTQYSDALRVLRADVSREYIVQIHNSGAAQFTLTANHDIADGQLLVVTDCNHAAVFQANGVGANTVNHVVGGIPGNSAQDLGNGGPVTYAAGSRLYRMDAVTYYVAPNGAGVPSLFRLTPTGLTAAPTADELVEGVEDLQVSFGVDTTPTADGTADYYTPEVAGVPYLTGSQVDVDATLGTTPQERWARVVSVRISLMIRTVEDHVVSTPQKLNFNGAEFDAPDLRLRKVFTHVVKLRNR